MRLPQWLRNILLSFVNVDEELDEALQTIDELKEEIIDLKTAQQKLDMSLLQQQNLINDLHTQIKIDIVKIDELQKELSRKDITKFENFLNNNYKHKKLVYTKRWAIKDKKLLSLNICDFLFPRLTLKDGSSLREIWTEKIKYVSDNYSYNGILDVWQLPEETAKLKGGDCEDSSDYRISKAKANGIGNNLFRGLGFYKGIGHAFPLLLDTCFELWVLESTTNRYKPVKLKGSRYHLCYISNERFTWEVDGSFRFGEKVLKEFNVQV